MAYEREAIAAVVPQSSPAVIMREDRVIEPYRQRQTTPKIGQPSTTVGTPGLEEPKDLKQVTPEETVTLSPAAAALARKEQKFRQQELDFKAKEKAMEAERLEIAELKALKERLGKKDYSGIEAHVDYNDYTNHLIEKSAGEDPVKDLRNEVAELKKSQQEEVSKRFDAAVNERRKAVSALVETPEFSSLKKAGQPALEAVVQHILDTWEHDSIDLPPEQAAKEVQETLKEQAKKWASLLEETQAEEPADGTQKQLPPLKTGVKTLTNNMMATGEIKRAQKSFQGMTDAERYAEARRRAEEKLAKR